MLARMSKKRRLVIDDKPLSTLNVILGLDPRIQNPA
jgi:hypothetical protein